MVVRNIQVDEGFFHFFRCASFRVSNCCVYVSRSFAQILKSAHVELVALSNRKMRLSCHGAFTGLHSHGVDSCRALTMVPRECLHAWPWQCVSCGAAVHNTKGRSHACSRLRCSISLIVAEEPLATPSISAERNVFIHVRAGIQIPGACGDFGSQTFSVPMKRFFANFVLACGHGRWALLMFFYYISIEVLPKYTRSCMSFFL